MSRAGQDKRAPANTPEIAHVCSKQYQLLSLVVQLQLRIALPSSMHPPPPDFITAYDYPSRLHAPLAPYLTALAKTIRDRLQQDGRLRVQEAPSDDETVRSERDEEKRESDWGQAAGIACLYLVSAAARRFLLG